MCFAFLCAHIALDTGYWTAINHFFVWGSLGLYFTILFIMHSSLLFSIFPKQFHFLGEAGCMLQAVWREGLP